MDLDYYSVLSKAVIGKDQAARDRIYRDAWNLIRNSPNLTRETAAAYTAALETAVRRIEDELAAEDARSAAEISATLSTGRNWLPLIAGAAVVAVLIAVGALFYVYRAANGPVTAEVKPPSPNALRNKADAVVGDLKAGVDGGSSAEGLPFAFQRQVVFYRTTVAPGSIVVDRESRFLYLIETNNSARRYGIGIADECMKGANLSRITSKVEWPEWKTPDARDAVVASSSRAGSVLGARGLLLDKPGLLIHGTNSPKTIGHLVASGCIRLVNDDVEDLYRRVPLETRVVFLG